MQTERENGTNFAWDDVDGGFADSWYIKCGGTAFGTRKILCLDEHLSVIAEFAFHIFSFSKWPIATCTDNMYNIELKFYQSKIERITFFIMESERFAVILPAFIIYESH